MTTPTPISDLTRLFINDGRYPRAWSERTVETCERALNAFGSTPLTKAGLSAWVVSLRQRGLSVTTVNIMARAVSSDLSWLHAEGHVHERLRIKQLPNPPKPIKVFSDAEGDEYAQVRSHPIGKPDAPPIVITRSPTASTG